MSKRKAPVWVKILMLAFLLYAVVTIISLHAQIADKRAELDSLNMRVEEYEAANEAFRQEMQNGSRHQRDRPYRAQLCRTGRTCLCGHIQQVKGKQITEAKQFIWIWQWERS